MSIRNRKSAQLRSITFEELPAWFDLDRYHELAEFELDDWLINLTWRAAFLNWLGDQIEEFRTEIEDRFQSNQGRPLAKRRTKPYDWANDRYSRGPESHPELKTATVRSLSVLNVAQIIKWGAEGNYEFSKKLCGAAEQMDSLDWSSDFQRFMSEPFDLQERSEIMGTDFGDVKAEIDLFAPDDVIIADFPKWLGSARKVFEIPSQRMFSDAQLSKWVEFRIIPYMDLTLWAKLEKVNISYAVLGNALFPDEFDVDLPDRIRRVTKPQADRLTQSRVIEAMVRQLRGASQEN